MVNCRVRCWQMGRRKTALQRLLYLRLKIQDVMPAQTSKSQSIELPTTADIKRAMNFSMQKLLCLPRNKVLWVMQKF